MISQIQQFEHHPDGTITLKGRPGVKLDLVEQQGLATARAIEKELGLPQYFEEWEQFAQPVGMSRRYLRCVVADQSVTTIKGISRLQPRNITFSSHSPCFLEFGHRGFLIGAVTFVALCPADAREDVKALGFHIPEEAEGDCLIATGQLFDSPLAAKAWEALQRGIFTHACPLLFRKLNEPLGSGQLVEVSLTTNDFPGCRNATILKTWEGDAI